MKKIIYFVLSMIIVILVLPFIIVGGYNINNSEISVPNENSTRSQADSDIKIKVYINELNTIEEMDLEEYVKGVVAAEMPAEFEIEALKAQAIAARTYAYGRYKKIYIPDDALNKGADVCTDHSHCQAWISKSDAMNGWDSINAYKYWNKIENAVNSTKGVIILYNDEIIDPVFHSNSGGKTENAEDVWPGEIIPYLRSVESSGETDNDEYINTVNIEKKDFLSKIKAAYPDITINESSVLSDIKIIDYTEGGRVNNIKIGSVTLRGTEFREIFDLKSANFKIEYGGGEKIKITTYGNGHGVGMSQWGANYLAKNGGSYEEILKYYYKGVELGNIEE